MGIDAVIFFSSEKEKPVFQWGSLIGASYKKLEKDDYKYGVDKATHRVFLDGNDRYYGEYYERGVWPTISGILMDLFASQDITAVFYGGDAEEIISEIKPRDVCELSLHYMAVGNRPYYDKIKKLDTNDK